jgi:hypothetical protein
VRNFVLLESSSSATAFLEFQLESHWQSNSVAFTWNRQNCAHSSGKGARESEALKVEHGSRCRAFRGGGVLPPIDEFVSWHEEFGVFLFNEFNWYIGL